MKSRGKGGTGRTHSSSSNPELDKMVRKLDDLAKFDDFRANLLPSLQEDLRKGLSGKELRKKYSPEMTAKAITIALKSKDDGKAMSAIKDLLDRDEGKAVERKDVTHHLEALSENELDAMLLTELSDLEVSNTPKDPLN